MPLAGQVFDGGVRHPVSLPEGYHAAGPGARASRHRPGGFVEGSGPSGTAERVLTQCCIEEHGSIGVQLAAADIGVFEELHLAHQVGFGSVG